MWFNLPLWIFTMRDTLFIANMILHALFVFLKEIQVFSFCVVILSGAIDYPSFLMLLKQLIPPLSTQLSDRRSSIVKQVALVNIVSSWNLLLFIFCYTIWIYSTWHYEFSSSWKLPHSRVSIPRHAIYLIYYPKNSLVILSHVLNYLSR